MDGFVCFIQIMTRSIYVHIHMYETQLCKCKYAYFDLKMVRMYVLAYIYILNSLIPELWELATNHIL